MFVLKWCFLFVTFYHGIHHQLVGIYLDPFLFKDQKLQKNRSNFLRDKGIVIENTTAPPPSSTKMVVSSRNPALLFRPHPGWWKSYYILTRIDESPWCYPKASKSTAGHEFLPCFRVFFVEPFTVASHVLLTRRVFERASPTMMFRA